VPFLKDHFGILGATFQWLDLPKSKTLVSQSMRKLEYQKYQNTRGTRKLEAPVQKSTDQVWRGESWIFINLTAPAYSPQLSASIPWIGISKFEVLKNRVSS
jgi:hypothetical protein